MSCSKCLLDYTLERHWFDQSKNAIFKVHTLSWSMDLSFFYNRNIRQLETENVDNIKDIQFRLKFKFNDYERDSKEIYYIYPAHDIIQNAVLEFYIKNSSNSTFNFRNPSVDTLIRNKTFKVEANKWQHLYSLNNDKISNLSESTSWTITLKFKFTMQNKPLNDKTSPAIVLPKHLLNNDLEHLLLDSMYSDVIVRSVDGFEFKVHKAILSSRSTVLKAYFAHDTLENKNNIVETHFDTEVLKEVLTYIYTEKIPRVQEMADKLLEAGEFYNLPGLKIACEQSLHLQLNKDNAIKTLQLADLYSATSLKQLTLAFIKDGYAGVVTKTDDWKSIKSLELIKTLYEFVTL